MVPADAVSWVHADGELSDKIQRAEPLAGPRRLVGLGVSGASQDGTSHRLVLNPIRCVQMGVHEEEEDDEEGADEGGIEDGHGGGQGTSAAASWRLAARRGLRLTYRVEPGVAPSSHGLAVAAQAGVPLSVLDRAEAIMERLRL